MRLGVGGSGERASVERGPAAGRHGAGALEDEQAQLGVARRHRVERAQPCLAVLHRRVAEARGNVDGLREALIDGTRVSVLLVAGVTTVLVSYAQPLVTHWMGSGFEGTVASVEAIAARRVIIDRSSQD